MSVGILGAVRFLGIATGFKKQRFTWKVREVPPGPFSLEVQFILRTPRPEVSQSWVFCFRAIGSMGEFWQLGQFPLL